MAKMFVKATTQVFWYLDGCKIPEDLTPFTIVENISAALRNITPLGTSSITVYCDMDQIQDKMRKALHFTGVTIINRSAGNKDLKVKEIIVDILSWGLKNWHGPSNLMLISQDFSGDKDFIRAIQALHRRSCNVLLVHPQCPSGPILQAIGTQFLWTSLARGEITITESEVAEPSGGGAQKRRKGMMMTNSDCED